MEIVILVILILLFILEISYTIKNKLSQTTIAICTLLFIYDFLVIFSTFPNTYEGLPRSEFSSEIAFFMSKLAYYMGLFVFLELAIIISYIPIAKHRKSQKNKQNYIECKVCGKDIPYNEYGTCEKCHQEVLNRLSKKQDIKDNIIEESNLSDSAKNKLEKEKDFLSEKDLIDIIQKLSANKIFCTNCGNEIHVEWKFCNHCGYKLKD